MTDIEFDILDELYFLISFEDLKKQTCLETNVLIDQLVIMFNKNWVQYYIEIDGEINPVLNNFAIEIQHCFLLATKKGLNNHNSK